MLDIDDLLDDVFLKFDTWHSEGKFSHSDFILYKLIGNDEIYSNIDFLIGVLTITKAAKNHLSNRAILFDDFYRFLVIEKSEIEAKKLLQGLE